MRVFKEVQRFDQWWIKLLLGVLVVVMIISFYDSYNRGNSLVESAFGLVIILLVCFLLLAATLKTRIDKDGITAKFSPASVFTRNYSWNDIEKVFVRKYFPITEYGGWGVRGFGKAKAYNTSGEMGIQIVAKNGERFLIGTQKPEDVKKIINRYSNNSEI